ncbi:protease inhibitor I42 family protein [Nocardia yamanashiensis]|uniref:protease inhibitor I42 family protein n=1 Tax=Nocardia yamanashiensis TaxID=209247 RepID=UPI000B16B66C|nr:protease inhibitor I42 family protein [Nocardia yamanashiensis]UGT41868.1 protease inhibitor I42 family protein [Nocardia yamanashiensis]
MRVRTPVAVLMVGLALTACGKDSDNSTPETVTVTAGSSTAGPIPTTSNPPLTTTSAEHEAVKIGKDANGKDVDLVPGQGLIVTLDANPSTGFAWELTELDQNILKRNGSPEYQQDPSPDGMVGVGGKAIWNFVAAGPGATRLTLEYRRAWEQGVEPAQRFQVTVNVK